MSALPQPFRQPNAKPIDRRDYVPATEAARVLGMSVGHLRRLCAEKLSHAGQAMMLTPEAGGNPCWHIARTFDRHLMGDVHSERYDAATIEQYTGKQRRVAVMKAQCVDRFRDAKVNRPGTIKQWMPALLAELMAAFPDLGRITRRSLYRWSEAYDGPADLEKLIDTRGGNVTSKGDPAAWSYFEAIYCEKRKPKLRTCWERTQTRAVEEGWQWCSETSCRRQLDERIPEAKRVRLRDPAKYRSKYAPYIQQSVERFAAGRCWVGDHGQMDFWCVCGQKLVRLFATTWMDWRTQKVVGWVLSPEPNSSTIMAAFGMAMRDKSNMGGPSEVVIDNGKDYDAFMFDGRSKQQRMQRKVLEAGYIDEPFFKGIYGLLNIEPHFSIPHNPNGKSCMERWFGVMHDHFDRSFPTYCGAKPEDKPEGLEEVLRQRRNVPTFDQVKTRFADFVAGYNASADHQKAELIDREHGNEKLSPDEAMRRWCTTRRVFQDGVLDSVMVCWSPPLKVGRNGVAITVAGQRLNYGQFDPALTRFKSNKRRVMVGYDPHDLAHVRVYDEQMRLVCIARANELGGIGGDAKVARKHIQRLSRAKRAYDKSMKFIQANPELQYLSKFEWAKMAAEEDARPPLPPTDPESLKLIQTPLDSEVNALGRQMKRRMAAGAESYSNDDDGGLPSLADLAGDFYAPSCDDDDDDIDGLNWLDLAADFDNDDDGDLLDELREEAS